MRGRGGLGLQLGDGSCKARSSSVPRGAPESGSRLHMAERGPLPTPPPLRAPDAPSHLWGTGRFPLCRPVGRGSRGWLGSSHPPGARGSVGPGPAQGPSSLNPLVGRPSELQPLSPLLPSRGPASRHLTCIFARLSPLPQGGPGLLGRCLRPGRAAGIYLGSQPPSHSHGPWEPRVMGG